MSPRAGKTGRKQFTRINNWMLRNPHAWGTKDLKSDSELREDMKKIL